MAKLPKLTDLTNVHGIIDKVKSAIESIAGPTSSAATEEALAKEKDPLKAKLLEAQLLINQMSDVQLIQTKTIAGLKGVQAELLKMVAETEEKKKTDSTAPEDSKSSEGSDNSASPTNTEQTTKKESEKKNSAKD